MTKIEEKFFKIFGVDNCSNCDIKNSLECYYCDNKYPEITSDILLKLICIIVSVQTSYAINEKNCKKLKNKVLQKAVNLKNYIAQDVRALFEEGAEDE